MQRLADPKHFNKIVESLEVPETMLDLTLTVVPGEKNFQATVPKSSLDQLPLVKSKVPKYTITNKKPDRTTMAIKSSQHEHKEHEEKTKVDSILNQLHKRERVSYSADMGVQSTTKKMQDEE